MPLQVHYQRHALDLLFGVSIERVGTEHISGPHFFPYTHTVMARTRQDMDPFPVCEIMQSRTPLPQEQVLADDRCHYLCVGPHITDVTILIHTDAHLVPHLCYQIQDAARVICSWNVHGVSAQCALS